MLSNLRPFGAPDCESDLAILGEDGYSRYYFHATYFNRQSLDPSVYLIVGRRGAGKTALAKFFSFQNLLKGSIEIYIDQPSSFYEIISKVVNQTTFNRDLQIPQLTRTWEYIVWSAIFHQLRTRDIRIGTACTVNANGGVSKIIRILMQSLLEKYLGSGRDLSDELDKLINSTVFEAAKEAVLDLAQTNPIIIAVDTLEKYSARDDTLMTTTAALVEFASKFSMQYAPANIHIKVFAMGEIFPYLTEEYVSNPLKYVRNEIYLHWRPKDLMRMICWRLFQYLRVHDNSRLRTSDIDWNSYRDVREKIWKPYFGDYLENGNLMDEETFPYVLRHTQLRPRQMIVLCNAIAEKALRHGNFPKFFSRDIISGIQNAQDSLADEVFNAYSSAYPNAARIAEALSGISPIFEAKELDKRAPRTSSQWTDGYSPYRFREFITELGIVGRVRTRNQGFVEADFEYATRGRLTIATEDECVIHPMFHTKLNVMASHETRIYPFPDHQEFKTLGHTLTMSRQS